MYFKQMYPKLVIFAGYSNSGKTTHVIPILRSLGYEILSSSVLLHDFSELLVKKVLQQTEYDSYDRNLSISIKTRTKNNSGIELTSSRELGSRQFLIDIAEEALVPVFTRAIFANGLADKIINNFHKDIIFAVECFNSTEAALFQKRLASANINSSVCFNLRRKSENRNADGRDLIPSAKEIWNNSTYEKLEQEIKSYLANLTQNS